MISTCIIASRAEIRREMTIAWLSRSRRDQWRHEIPLIYPTRSFTPLSGPIPDSRSIHTYVVPVKFYGSGCLERFLDYTHLKKISHESLQRRRVFTRRLHFLDVSVNIPYLRAFTNPLSDVADARRGFPSRCTIG